MKLATWGCGALGICKEKGSTRCHASPNFPRSPFSFCLVAWKNFWSSWTWLWVGVRPNCQTALNEHHCWITISNLQRHCNISFSTPTHDFSLCFFAYHSWITLATFKTTSINIEPQISPQKKTKTRQRLVSSCPGLEGYGYASRRDWRTGDTTQVMRAARSATQHGRGVDSSFVVNAARLEQQHYQGWGQRARQGRACGLSTSCRGWWEAAVWVSVLHLETWSSK